MKKLLTLLLIFTSISFFAQKKYKTVVENVDASVFKQYCVDKKNVIIDLRTAEEIQKEGMIKGAAHFDFLAKNSEENIAKLERGKTYLIYCAGGGRSADCAAFMEKEGFFKVVNLQKGFSDWKKQGFHIDK